jgi:predicted GIY-YIG superfamily endonuclease
LSLKEEDLMVARNDRTGTDVQHGVGNLHPKVIDGMVLQHLEWLNEQKIDEYLADAQATLLSVLAGHPVDATRRIGTSYLAGLLTCAVALSLDPGDPDSVGDLDELMIGYGLALESTVEVAERFAEALQRNPSRLRNPRLEPDSREFDRSFAKQLRDRQRYATAEECRRLADNMARFLADLAAGATDAHAKYKSVPFCRFASPSFPLPVTPSPTALYRWYDGDDVLLYVGITGDVATRQSSHAKKSSWAEFAARCAVERFPDRASAEDSERAAIENERPLFNHVHNDSPDARRRLVEYLVAQGRTDLLAPAVSRG